MNISDNCFGFISLIDGEAVKRVDKVETEELFNEVERVYGRVGPHVGEPICDMDVWPSPVILV
jgi:hypothetical protein